MSSSLFDSLNPFAGHLSRHALVLRTFRMTLAVAIAIIPVYGMLLMRIGAVDSWEIRIFWTAASAGTLFATYRSAWIRSHSGLLLGSLLIGLVGWLGVLALINGLHAEVALQLTFTFFSLGIVFGIAFETIQPLLIYIGVEIAIAVAVVAATPAPGVDAATFLFGFSASGLLLLAGTYNRLKDRGELQAHTRLLRSAERLGGIGSWSHNLETGARRWSQGMYDVVAVPLANGEPPLMSDFMPPESQKRIEYQEHAFLRGDVDTDDDRYQIVRADGETREVRSIAQLIRTDDGTPRRLIGVVVDVTAQSEYEKQLDEARREAESAAALKSSILANMSHEIRTPLTAVIGFARVLRDELGGELDDLVEPIETGGQRLLTTLDSVLDFARIEAGEIDLRARPINLSTEARDLVPLFRRQAEAKGIGLHIDAPEAPVYALASPGELGRALTNLISNAIKFTASGEVAITVREEAKAAIVTVRDTGQGIDPAFMPRLYEPFQQESSGNARRHEGSGLGLAITQRIILAMGGTIEVDSTPGAGTAFTLRLLRAEPSAPEAVGTAWISLASRTGASGERTSADPRNVSVQTA